MPPGSGVIQSGLVSPLHSVVWITDGVIGDGGPSLLGQKVLGSLRGANFNVVSDQPIILAPSVSAFQLNGVIVTNASAPLSVATGGFYTAAAKGGSAIVAAGQVYSALSASNLLMSATLTAFAQAARFSASNLAQLLNTNGQYGLAIYFALTTAQGQAATADIYAVGTDLS